MFGLGGILSLRWRMGARLGMGVGSGAGGRGGLLTPSLAICLILFLGDFLFVGKEIDKVVH